MLEPTTISNCSKFSAVSQKSSFPPGNRRFRLDYPIRAIAEASPMETASDMTEQSK
jgi:hypothetical protein